MVHSIYKDYGWCEKYVINSFNFDIYFIILYFIYIQGKKCIHVALS